MPYDLFLVQHCFHKSEPAPGFELEDLSQRPPGGSINQPDRLRHRTVDGSQRQSKNELGEFTMGAELSHVHSDECG
jgi:hypothetical protein